MAISPLFSGLLTPLALPTAAAPAAAPAPAGPPFQQFAKFIQGYFDSVDQNGNVNQDKLTKLVGGDVTERRTGIVLGYALEFAQGDRLKNLGDNSKIFSQYSADAQIFMQVASRYKNAGGNYNNGKLKQLLEKAGRKDLIKAGVGDKDVQTLHAVAKAISDGDLKLSQVFDGTGNDAVDDDNKYQRAINAVKAGDFGSSIEKDDGTRPGKANAAAAGNAGNAGNAGKAATAGATVAPGAAPAAAPAAALNNPMSGMLLQFMSMLLQFLSTALGKPLSSAAGGPFTNTLGGTAGTAGTTGAPTSTAGTAGNAGTTGAPPVTTAGTAGGAGNAGGAGDGY